MDKLFVLSFGSRGDVQPYIALCTVLKRRGFTVMLGTNLDHMAFAKQFGIDAVPLFEDCETIVKTDTNFQKSMADGDVLGFLSALEGPDRIASWAAYAPAFLSTLKSYAPAAVLCGTLTYWHGVRPVIRALDPSTKHVTCCVCVCTAQTSTSNSRSRFLSCDVICRRSLWVRRRHGEWRLSLVDCHFTGPSSFPGRCLQAT